MLKDSFLYVSTHDGIDGGGVYCTRFDKQNGVIYGFRKVAALQKAGLMTQHPHKDCLYVVGIDEKYDDPNGCIAAYYVDSIIGELTLLNKKATGAGLPTFITTEKDGGLLFQVSFSSAAASILKILNDGSLVDFSRIYSFSGSGSNPIRQTSSNPHCINMHSKDNCVFVCDLGADRIIRFRLDIKQQDLETIEPYRQSINPGAGPRIMRFSNDGKYVYIINELDNSVSVYSYLDDRNDIEPLQVVSSLPDSIDGSYDQQMASEIRLHPNQQFLYVSNRSVGEGKFDGMGVFKRDVKTGKLSPIQFCRTGKHPRHFNIDLTGQWLVVSARDSNEIHRFKIDEATGELKEVGNPINFQQPWDIQFFDS